MSSMRSASSTPTSTRDRLTGRALLSRVNAGVAINTLPRDAKLGDVRRMLAPPIAIRCDWTSDC